jgi:hypothetical protein
LYGFRTDLAGDGRGWAAAVAASTERPMLRRGDNLGGRLAPIG